MSRKLKKIIIGLSVTLFLTVGTIIGTVALSKYDEETETIEISTKSGIITNFNSNITQDSTGVDQIQETTITRVVDGELKKVTEERNLTWEPMELNLEKESAKINATKIQDITIQKAAETQRGNGQVAPGENIVYKLKIKNNGKENYKQVEISDSIPKNTTYVETQDKSLKIKENNQVIALKWYVDINAGETVEITFTVKVNEKATGIISNIALANGNKSEEVKTTIVEPIIEEPIVERQIQVTKNTENIKTTNSNIVLVIDISGSMAENNRLTNAKAAAEKLIDGVDFTSGGQIGIVTFSSGGWNDREWDWNQDNAQTLKIEENKDFAINTQDATTLKSKIENLKADGGTRIADGLAKAKTMIEKMATQKPQNGNIVIVLSDGAYNAEKYNNGTYGDELLNTGKETVSRVKEKANALKNGTAKPKVYTIAVLAQNETPGNTAIMTEIIPSSKSNYIKATDGYDNLINAFKKIESSISGGATQTKTSVDGKVELEDIKSVDSIVIKVNGNIVTNTNDYLIKENAKVYVDVTKFGTNDKIEVEYMAN